MTEAEEAELIRGLPDLKMPGINEKIFIKFLGKFAKIGTYVYGHVILLNSDKTENGHFKSKFTKTVWLGTLAELLKKDIKPDDDLECLGGKIISITGKEYGKYHGIDKEGKEWKSKIFVIKME